MAESCTTVQNGERLSFLADHMKQPLVRPGAAVKPGPGGWLGQEHQVLRHSVQESQKASGIW